MHISLAFMEAFHAHPGLQALTHILYSAWDSPQLSLISLIHVASMFKCESENVSHSVMSDSLQLQGL